MADTAVVTVKMAEKETSHVSGATDALSELVRSMAVESGTDKMMETSAREQRVMARSAVAAAALVLPLTVQEDVRVVRSLSVTAVNSAMVRAADVVELMPPLTDQENARIARSLSSSPARAALTAPVKGVLLETFHTSVPTAGDFSVGQRVAGNLGVLVAGGGTKGRECKGNVMYIGKLAFEQSGEVWIGVCFDEAVGKNDGTVKGKTYFECPAMHGRFVRPKHLRLSKETSVDSPRWSSYLDRTPGAAAMAGDVAAVVSNVGVTAVVDVVAAGSNAGVTVAVGVAAAGSNAGVMQPSVGAHLQLPCRCLENFLKLKRKTLPKRVRQ